MQLVLIDADEDEIRIKATAFQTSFRGAQNVICVELLFLVQIVPGMDGETNTNQVWCDPDRAS